MPVIDTLIEQYNNDRSLPDYTDHPADALTDDDWVEIYYTLDARLTAPVTEGDIIWRQHLASILAKIGPDGKKMWK